MGRFNNSIYATVGRMTHTSAKPTAIVDLDRRRLVGHAFVVAVLMTSLSCVDLV